MSFHKEDGMGSLCHKALQIISELCLGGKVELEKCSGIFPLETTNQGISSTDISVSLLAVVVSFCGLALLLVSLFVFWKLCWPCWRSKPMTSNTTSIPQSTSSAPPEILETNEKKEPIKENGKPSAKILEAAMKISHTSPDIPAEVQNALKEHLIKHARMQRQITEPTSSS
ncbi:Synaptotagmin-10, partial [Varanus komodoensis]